MKGERLWVRETFHDYGHWSCYPKAAMEADSREDWRWQSHNRKSLIRYAADNPTDLEEPNTYGHRKMPSIHMKRTYSRLLLEVSMIRAERLRDISETDAKAEGVGAWHDGIDGTTYRGEFGLLWDSINAKRDNGAYSWKSNPWVWVVEFKQVTP